MIDRLRDRARAWLAGRVRAALAPRRDAWEAARAGVDDARRRTADLRARTEHALSRLDVRPFRPDLTVHAAHARHPGVQAVFARHGLPRCPDCAVGADETLAEAADGEGLDLRALLDELDALLTLPR